MGEEPAGFAMPTALNRRYRTNVAAAGKHPPANADIDTHKREYRHPQTRIVGVQTKSRIRFDSGLESAWPSFHHPRPSPRLRPHLAPQGPAPASSSHSSSSRAHIPEPRPSLTRARTVSRRPTLALCSAPRAPPPASPRASIPHLEPPTRPCSAPCAIRLCGALAPAFLWCLQLKYYASLANVLSSRACALRAQLPPRAAPASRTRPAPPRPSGFNLLETCGKHAGHARRLQ